MENRETGQDTVTGLNQPGRSSLRGRLVLFLKILATFHLVALAWIFFRAPTLEGAGHYLWGILSLRGGQQIQGTPRGIDRLDFTIAVVGMALVVLLLDLPQYRRGDHTVLLRWPWLLRVCVLGLLLACVLLTRRAENVAFLYFQF